MDLAIIFPIAIGYAIKHFQPHKREGRDALVSIVCLLQSPLRLKEKLQGSDSILPISHVSELQHLFMILFHTAQDDKIH